MNAQEVFYSDENFQLECYKGSGREFTFISFSNYKSNNYESKPFALDYCLKRGISLISIKSSKNYWYHNFNSFYIDLLKEKLKSMPGRIVLTGSSMGGSAAIVFAKELDAELVISYSPQYSFDSDFEHRYNSEKGKFEKHYDVSDPKIYSVSAKYFIVYDPYDIDFLHFKCFQKLIVGSIDALGLPFSGHPSIALMRDAGILSKYVDSILKNNNFVVSGAQRRKSLIYFCNLSMALVKRKKYELSVSIATYALDNIRLFRGNKGAEFDLKVNLVRNFIKLGRKRESIQYIDEILSSNEKMPIGYLLRLEYYCTVEPNSEMVSETIENSFKRGLDIGIFRSRENLIRSVGLDLNNFLR